MNLLWKIALLCVVLIYPCQSALAGELPPSTERTPFTPPAHIAQLKAPAVRKTATGLQLRATMLTEQWTMANVNGTMLVPGETINDYRLLQVRENEAVFIKDGKQIVVAIDAAN
jgi:hypothetical protein